MGKRKVARKPVAKTKLVLDKEFDCLFCNHEKTVTCKLDKETKIGHLLCKACGVTFQTNINYLSAPIDVYSDWVDACEGVESVQRKPSRVMVTEDGDESLDEL